MPIFQAETEPGHVQTSEENEQEKAKLSALKVKITANPVLKQEDFEPLRPALHENWMVYYQQPDVNRTLSYLSAADHEACGDTGPQAQAAARKIGQVYHKGTQQQGVTNFHTVAAGDMIATDGEHVLLILRASPPGKGLPCLPGGLTDVTNDEKKLEDILKVALREAVEEVHLRDVPHENIHVLSDRKTARNDNREAANASFGATYGINKGDTFSVTTTGVVAFVGDLRERINDRHIKPGTDAAVTFLMDITELEKTGVADHLELIHDAVMEHPELFHPRVIEHVATKRLETLEERLIEHERFDFVANNLYNHFVTKGRVFDENDIHLYKQLEQQAEREITTPNRDKVEAEIALINNAREVAQDKLRLTTKKRSLSYESPVMEGVDRPTSPERNLPSNNSPNRSQSL